jgi:hypothetical protein
MVMLMVLEQVRDCHCFHIVSLIVLFTLVFPFPCSSDIIWEFFLDLRKCSSPCPGPGYLNHVYGDFSILMRVFLLARLHKQ